MKFPWFREVIRQSEKNGKISYLRLPFSWGLQAQGMYQASDYLTRLWKQAFARMPRSDVKSVLMLGLSAGVCVNLVRKHFHSPKLTVIEWDSVMVEFADELAIFKPQDRPEILIGDVRDMLPKLHGTYDLIICDLFDGPKVSPTMRDASMIETLSKLLSREGSMLVNVFQEPEIFDEFSRVFSQKKTWKYLLNHVGWFQHFGRGTVGDPLPNGYVPSRMIEEYVTRESYPGTFYTRVGQPGCPGMRWRHGPLGFEGYLGDTEPRIDGDAPSRLIVWQPVMRTEAPPGWWKSFLPASPKLTGFADVTGLAAYWKNWSPHMQRHRMRWLKTTPYPIESVTLEEFTKSYGHRRMASWLVRLMIGLLKNKVMRHGDRTHFFGARDPQTGKLVAGFAALDVPEGEQSIHLASFVTKPVKRSSVGVGLVDHWFRTSIEQGIRFMDFDLFWAPGLPRDWKGFSRFKSQFGVTFVSYPHPFLRIVKQRKKSS